MGSVEVSVSENAITRMQDCRLENIYTDVTIQVGEEEFRAHRAVIAKATPVLRVMCSESLSKEDGVIHFKEENIDSSVVGDILDFFYTGKIVLTKDNVHSVCAAAHYLYIPEVLSACEKLIIRDLQSSDVLELFLFSRKLQLETLRKGCIDFLFQRHEEAFQNPKITGFKVEDFNVIITEMGREIKGRDLKYKESLFEAIITWFEYDQVNRSSTFPALLKNLSLQGLSRDFLTQVALNQKVISDSAALSKLVMEAANKASSGRSRQSIAIKEESKLFCFGGRNKAYTHLSSVSVFDFATSQWSDSTPIPSTKCYFGGAKIGNKVYLCGGFNNGSTSDAFQVFDCFSDSWTRLQPMPGPRNFIDIAVLDKFIYVAGGSDFKGVLSSVIRYCVRTNRWMIVKPMQIPRHSHKLIELNGLLYAIGGIGNRNTAYTVERYNPQTDEWTMATKTRYDHIYAGATAYKGKIYIHSENGFEVYTPESNTWRTLKAVHQARGCNLVAIKDKLWSLGGGRSASVYEFDTVTEQWTQLPNMDEVRSNYCSFFMNC